MAKIISIHAPARGATIHMTFLAPKYRYFNPRSREGSDVLRKRHSVIHILISIHAPARGATIKNVGDVLPDKDFNPRSREGSDDYDTVNFWQARDFNPRSREGSD